MYATLENAQGLGDANTALALATMNARGLLAAGYVARPDGTFARQVSFVGEGRSASGIVATETLVRSSTGKLLRVERSGRALARRGKLAP